MAHDEVGQKIGVSMAIETTPSTPANAAVQQGWVFVLMEEKRLRQLLLTLLSQAGYVLLGCASLAEAEPILRQQAAPSLILLDGSGASEAAVREQLRHIARLLPTGTPCKVIVFSLAHPLPRLQQLPGVDAVIARPFDLGQVLAAVEKLMQAA